MRPRSMSPLQAFESRVRSRARRRALVALLSQGRFARDRPTRFDTRPLMDPRAVAPVVPLESALVRSERFDRITVRVWRTPQLVTSRSVMSFSALVPSL